MRHNCFVKPIYIFPAFFISVLLLCLVTQVFAADYDDKISKSFQVKKGQQFYLKSDIGSVTVESWLRDEVKIVVHKKAKAYSQREAERIFKDLDLRFDQSRQGVSLIAEYRGANRWFFGRRNLRVSFEIVVPYEFDLNINTAGGGIEIEKIMGQVDLHTSGGSITAAHLTGPVDAKTSGGSISISYVEGSLKAVSSGGSITLNEIKGNTSVRTSGGRLKLKKISGNVQGQTSGGSIYAELIDKINDDCSLKTSGGGITVFLHPDVSVEIDARTSGGSVATDFPVQVTGKIKSNYLTGKINRGGPLLKLRTSGGGIRIKEYVE